MNLQEAVRLFEVRFERVVTGLAMWRGQTGEPYDIVMAGGSREEGEQAPCWCVSEHAAVSLWLRSAHNYANSHPGRVLYWRTRPELTDNGPAWLDPGWATNSPPNLNKSWQVYSRLLISDLPAKLMLDEATNEFVEIRRIAA